MADDADDEEWLTPPKAAQLLHLKPKTLQEYRVTGGGPKFYKLGPGRNARVVYKRVDLRAWVEKHGFESTSEYKKDSD
jgi:hypothetical protein